MVGETFHEILKNLYTDLIPLCDKLTAVAMALAGFGALFYFAYRVWKSLAEAERIDVFSLLRPFVIGFCIMSFSTVVLGTMNAVLSPIVIGTHELLAGENLNMISLTDKLKDVDLETCKKNAQAAYLEKDEAFETKLKELGIGQDEVIKDQFEVEIKGWGVKAAFMKMITFVLQVVFMAATLVLDTLRTFFLIVLSILGPLAFAFSVFDGFHSSLTQWLCRYISIYLWLPVSDVFSCIMARIQTIMIDSNFAELNGADAMSSDTVCIIFLIIGIVGYFSVPTVANWIVQSGGTGSYGRNLSRASNKAGAMVGGAAGALSGNIVGRLKK